MAAPRGVGVDPKTRHVFVASNSTSSVVVIDAETNTIAYVIPVGVRPMGVGTHDTKRIVYVANNGSATVSVIDDQHADEGGADWSVPANLGPDVNSPFVENGPFVTADGLSLYFSSNRPGG